MPDPFLLRADASAVHQVGQRARLEEVEGGCADLSPLLVSRAPTDLSARSPAQQALALLPQVVESGHHLDEADLVGRAGQPEASGAPALGREETVVCQRLEDLGQVVGGNVQRLGQLGGGYRAAVPVPLSHRRISPSAARISYLYISPAATPGTTRSCSR